MATDFFLLPSRAAPHSSILCYLPSAGGKDPNSCLLPETAKAEVSISFLSLFFWKRNSPSCSLSPPPGGLLTCGPLHTSSCPPGKCSPRDLCSWLLLATFSKVSLNKQIIFETYILSGNSKLYRNTQCALDQDPELGMCMFVSRNDLLKHLQVQVPLLFLSIFSVRILPPSHGLLQPKASFLRKLVRIWCAGNT